MTAREHIHGLLGRAVGPVLLIQLTVTVQDLLRGEVYLAALLAVSFVANLRICYSGRRWSREHPV